VHPKQPTSSHSLMPDMELRLRSQLAQEWVSRASLPCVQRVLNAVPKKIFALNSQGRYELPIRLHDHTCAYDF
jgi:hypothetical protein